MPEKSLLLAVGCLATDLDFVRKVGGHIDHDVLFALSCEAAFTAALTFDQKPACVLVVADAPYMGGLRLATALRSRKDTAACKVVIWSVLDSLDEARRAKIAGAKGIVHKIPHTLRSARDEEVLRHALSLAS